MWIIIAATIVGLLAYPSSSRAATDAASRAAALPATARPATALPATAGSARIAASPRCQQENMPVALTPGAQASYTMVGWLCAYGPLRGRTVQVLVPGLTYDAYYWNFPLDPQRYSYVRYADAAGYATLAIDRLGTGASSHPAATVLTAQTEAYTVHQIVADLHAGRLGHTRFGKVMLVGHSYGSEIALNEAATYHDVSGLISTDWLTAGNLAGHLTVRDSYEPASDDPTFANLPAGYMTTKPDAKGPDFYNLSYADPAVVTEDNALRQTVTTSEVVSVADPIPQATTLSIDVPVLLVVGQDDALNCNATAPGLSCANSAAIMARESANYSPQACLRAFVLPRAGHSINLHPDAPEWFAVADTWSDRHVGPFARRPADRCG
jgi:pimeloyl-ACP methyl ester carboxylesterase